MVLDQGDSRDANRGDFGTPFKEARTGPDGVSVTA